VPIEGSDFRGSRHQATRIEFDPKSAPDESPVRAVSLQKMTRIGNCNTAGGGVGLAAAHLGSTGVRLRAKQGSACTTVRLPDLRADENYQLGFEQRTIRGAPARVCVWFDATGECANASTSSKLTRNFRKTLAEFTTPKDDSTARLFLYADGLGAGETVTEYRNFSLKRIVPYALVTFEEHAQRTPRVDVLSAQRERIRFRVRQAATFVLAMADATDPGWKIEGVPKGSNVRPVLVDGYRQGWQIRTTSPFVGTIRFRPARWLRWAQAASFISIAALLALVAYRLTTRYRRGRLFEPEAHIE
jgi:hypothetical protein